MIQCGGAFAQNQKMARFLNREGTAEEEPVAAAADTEREAIVKQRVGQNAFRERLYRRYRGCNICGLKNKSLLIAGHIKPWAVSDPFERLDLDNGFLLSAGHDALFDKGLITFDERGGILCSPQLIEEDRMRLRLETALHLSDLERKQKYLEWHRKYVFQMESL